MHWSYVFLALTHPYLEYAWEKPILLSLQWWCVDFQHNQCKPYPKCAHLPGVYNINGQKISDMYNWFKTLNHKCRVLTMNVYRWPPFVTINMIVVMLLVRFACAGPHMKLQNSHNNFRGSYGIDMDWPYVNCCWVIFLYRLLGIFVDASNTCLVSSISGHCRDLLRCPLRVVSWAMAAEFSQCLGRNPFSHIHFDGH